MLVVYWSATGNVRRFVKNTGMKSYEIDYNNPFVSMTVPFVLIAPTYEASETEILWDFMRTENNAELCQGFIGSGNLNFNDLYIFTASDLANDFNKPIIFDFEYFGTPKDIETFKKEMERLTDANN